MAEQTGVTYSLSLVCVGKYSSIPMGSAPGGGGARRAQQLWAGVGEGVEERGLGGEGVNAGERLVLGGVCVSPWMDFPGREGALPPPLPSRRRCAGPAGWTAGC